MVLELVNVELTKVGVANESVVHLSIVALGREVESSWKTVVIHISHTNSSEAPTNSQDKQHHLKDRDKELEEEEAGIAIDFHKIFPAQSTNIDGSRKEGQWVSSTLQ